jgi:hypothetical protein
MRLACALLACFAAGALSSAAGAAGKCAKKHEAAGCKLSRATYSKGQSRLNIESPKSYVYAGLDLKCNGQNPNGQFAFARFADGQPGSQLLLPAKLKVGKTYTRVWHLDYPSLKGTRSVTVTISSAKNAVVKLKSDTTQTDQHCVGASTLKMKRSA